MQASSLLPSLSAILDIGERGQTALALVQGRLQLLTPTGLYVDILGEVVKSGLHRPNDQPGLPTTFDTAACAGKLAIAHIDLWDYTLFAPALDAQLRAPVTELLVATLSTETGLTEKTQKWVGDLVSTTHVLYMQAVWQSLPEYAQIRALWGLAAQDKAMRDAVRRTLTSDPIALRHVVTILNDAVKSLAETATRPAPSSSSGVGDPYGFATAKTPLAGFADPGRPDPGSLSADDPLEYAWAQCRRAEALADLAGTSGADRGARLTEALASFEQALKYITPDAAPASYARIQLRCGDILSHLATLPDEPRVTRIEMALDAYRLALRHMVPEADPALFARVQQARGQILMELARGDRQQQRDQLHEAISALDEALRFRTPGGSPNEYVQTQQTRGSLLIELSLIKGEDRHLRLRQALIALNEALDLQSLRLSPDEYAVLQNRRGWVLLSLSSFGGENPRGRLHEAFGAYNEVLAHYNPASRMLDLTEVEKNRDRVLDLMAKSMLAD